VTAADSSKIAAARERAIDFLRTTQSDDGGWTTNRTPGISGLVIAGLLDNGLDVDDPMPQKALKNLSSFIQSDGMGQTRIRRRDAVLSERLDGRI
jgi:squalene-hopene/tetraprenyl-beta-curcumene cyclase